MSFDKSTEPCTVWIFPGAIAILSPPANLRFPLARKFLKLPSVAWSMKADSEMFAALFCAAWIMPVPRPSTPCRGSMFTPCANMRMGTLSGSRGIAWGLPCIHSGICGSGGGGISDSERAMMIACAGPSPSAGSECASASADCCVCWSSCWKSWISCIPCW